MPAKVSRPEESADPQAFSVDEFASAFRISRATVYNMWRAGQGPARMRVLGRVVISRAAADDWRRRMESQAEAA